MLTNLPILKPAWGFPGVSDGKVSACNAGDLGSISGSGRSPGEGNGNPLQYSCLENPMDGGAWWATVHGVAKSWTGLKWLSSSSSSICLNVKIPLHLLHIKSMLQECTYVFPVALRTRKTFTPFEKLGIGERSGSSIPWRRVHSRSSLGSASPTMANLESFFLPSRSPYSMESTLLRAQVYSLSSRPQVTCPIAGFQLPHSVLISGIYSFLLFAHHITFFTTVSCTPCPIACLRPLIVPNRPFALSLSQPWAWLKSSCIALYCKTSSVWPCGFLHSGQKSWAFFLPVSLWLAPSLISIAEQKNQ